MGIFMLNADKIRLMTDLAIYEKKHEKEVFAVNDFYRHDYIAGQLLSAFVRWTLCFLMLLGAYVLVQTDVFFYNINEKGITRMLNLVGAAYFAGLGLYLLIAYQVSARRYQAAKRGILLYASKLKRLGRKYLYMKKNEVV